MQYLSKFKIVIPAIVVIIVSALSFGSHATYAQGPSIPSSVATTVQTAHGPVQAYSIAALASIPGVKREAIYTSKATVSPFAVVQYAYTQPTIYRYSWYGKTLCWYAAAQSLISPPMTYNYLLAEFEWGGANYIPFPSGGQVGGYGNLYESSYCIAIPAGVWMVASSTDTAYFLGGAIVTPWATAAGVSY